MTRPSIPQSSAARMKPPYHLHGLMVASSLANNLIYTMVAAFGTRCPAWGSNVPAELQHMLYSAGTRCMLIINKVIDNTILVHINAPLSQLISLEHYYLFRNLLLHHLWLFYAATVADVAAGNPDKCSQLCAKILSL